MEGSQAKLSFTLLLIFKIIKIVDTYKNDGSNINVCAHLELTVQFKMNMLQMLNMLLSNTEIIPILLTCLKNCYECKVLTKVSFELLISRIF